MDTSVRSQRRGVLDAPLSRGMTRQIQSLVLQQIDRGVEDLARLLVALALHLLHPFIPQRLAGELLPAGELIGRNPIAIELVVAGLDLFEHALLGGVEEILAPELRAG